MLKSIEIENFKCFGQRVTIPLAPITLIYGENSAGKSSILQALNLLKQTRELAPRGVALLPSHRNGIVNLGSYRDLIHDHGTGELGIKLVFEHEKVRCCSELASYLAAQEPNGDEAGEIRCASSGFLATRTGDETFSYEMSFQNDVKANRTKLSSLELRVGDANPGCVRFVTRSRTTAYDHVQSECVCPVSRHCSRGVYDYFCQHRTQMLRTIERLQMFVGKDPGGYGITLSEITELHTFYSKPFSYEEFCQRNQVRKFHYAVDPDSFIPQAMPIVIPSDDHILLFGLRYGSQPGDMQDALFARSPEIDWEENTVWRCSDRADLMRTAMSRGQPDDEITKEVNTFGDILKSFFTNLVTIGPFRTPPERWHVLSGGAPQDVGYSGENVAEILLNDESRVDELNWWLKRLTGYECQTLGSDLPGAAVVRYFDTRRVDPVGLTLADVGYGISQIIPVIVECVISDQRCVTIEQPEVHIHPQLQAELGDLFCEHAAIRARERVDLHDNRNQFLIETHSEHLMLRIQKLMRKGRLQPEDVSVLYVSRGEDGSIVQRLRLNDKGEFLDPWPDGFFPERLNEVFGD